MEGQQQQTQEVSEDELCSVVIIITLICIALLCLISLKIKSSFVLFG